jgi:phage FluMu protein Com
MNVMNKLKCQGKRSNGKDCDKVLGEADFNGLIKERCPRCKAMNVYVKRLSGKVYSFVEKE